MSAMPGPFRAPSGRVVTRLEGAVGRVDGVVMAGQDDLDRRLGPRRDHQGIAARLSLDRSVVADGGETLRRNPHDVGRQAVCLCLQQVQRRLSAFGVIAAGVDLCPADRAFDEDRRAPPDQVEGGMILCKNPHVLTLTKGGAKVNPAPSGRRALV